MSGEKAQERAQEEAQPGQDGQDAPRVVDKRRVREDAEKGADAAEGGAQEQEAPRAPAYVEQLEAKVAAAEAQLRAHIERIDRETAQFRARQEREMERRTQEAKKQAVAGFLTIADDLARATKAAGSGAGQEDFRALAKGVEMIYHRFFQELENLGVEPIVVLGEPFNPAEHEAVRMVEVNERARDGVVVEELSPGYRLGDAVLRPARVSVGRFAAGALESPPLEPEPGS